jgi:hypothetical protein
MLHPHLAACNQRLKPMEAYPADSQKAQVNLPALA